MNDTTTTPSGITAWILACRPKTLWAGVAPVMIGTAMAYESGGFHLVAALTCLMVAVTIQIGTNFANDYFDYIKGADTEERIGPLRVTQAGIISPAAIRRAFILVFAISALLGLSLLPRGGWPIVVIAAVSIASGILYTGGPFPLGYNGLGDLFAFVFFGPVAVAGTYYVQAQSLHWSVLLAGVGPGLFSVAMITVNNLRDMDSDVTAGKRTLAVLLGRAFARYEFLLAILLASLVPLLLCIWRNDHYLALLSCAALPAAIPAMRTIFTRSDGASLNRVLASTGKLLLLYSLCFSVGWVW